MTVAACEKEPFARTRARTWSINFFVYVRESAGVRLATCRGPAHDDASVNIFHRRILPCNWRETGRAPEERHGRPDDRVRSSKINVATYNNGFRRASSDNVNVTVA